MPVAYFAARNVTPYYPITYPLARGIIVLSRSVHELIFALIFVSALGLGPLPGIIALGVRSIGFLAKTTAEAIENADRRPVEAMEATGANALVVFLFGNFPQIFPIVVGNVIFQLDINLRRASILGMVGAGGIGYVFAEQMQACPDLRIHVSGHADATGTRSHNMILSRKRAIAVRSYLLGRGIDDERLSTEGFGPERPVAPNDTAAGRAANRRVQTTIRSF